MDENVLNRNNITVNADQENNYDHTSNLVADCNDNGHVVDVEQAGQEADFQQQHAQDELSTGGNFSDVSVDSQSQVAQLEDSSFEVTDPAFPDSDATNCTSSPVNSSLAEEMVNVTLYDDSSTHVEDMLEEDNLHGLSIHSQVTANNDVSKEIQMKSSDADSKHNMQLNQDQENDQSHQQVFLQNKPLDNCVVPNQPHPNEVNEKNSKASADHLSRKDAQDSNVTSKQNTVYEAELQASNVLVSNCTGATHHSKSFNHNFHQKPVKSPEADKQVQSMIEKNLEKLSPKKEALSRELMEVSSSFLADKNCTPVTPDRPIRVNPFNNIDCTEEHNSVDLWQRRSSPTDTTPASDLQSVSNHKVNSDLCNHPLPSSPLQDQNSPHSSKARQRNWPNLPNNASFNPNPRFDLMPSQFVKPQLNDGNASSDIDDIDAVVREVKKKISSPSQPLDDPWLKATPQEPESDNHPEEQVPSSEPHYEASELRLAKSQKQEVEKSLPKQPTSLIRPLIEAAGPCEPSDLVEGVIFAANYLGSTQLQSERNPGKNARMLQAQEAVNRIKAPEGESQPSVEVDLFISTDKVKILNADTQETMMDHTLRSISYIADIGKLLVIMAKRRSPRDENREEQQIMREPKPQKAYRVICHVFSSMDAHVMAQAIGQAFNVAYQQFLTANGIEPQTLTRDDYNQILDMQDMYHDDLVHYSKRENVKDLWVEKKKGENLGMVIVESGWGSIVPTVILANLQHGGPAERCGKLSIGDQIMNVNGTSLVGLPLTTCQSIIKGLKAQTIARLHVVSCPPVVTVLIKRPDLKYQLGFSVQDGIICSLMRGGIAERGGVRVGHRIIEINNQSVVAIQHEKIVQTLVSSVGEIQMKTMPAMMFRLLTGQEQPVYI